MSGGTREDGVGTLAKGIWQLTGIGQENIMTFLLFWIGLYVSILIDGHHGRVLTKMLLYIGDHTRFVLALGPQR